MPKMKRDPKLGLMYRFRSGASQVDVNLSPTNSDLIFRTHTTWWAENYGLSSF